MSGSTLKTQYSLSGFKDGSVPFCAHLSTPTALPKAFALQYSLKWVQQAANTDTFCQFAARHTPERYQHWWSFSTGYPHFPDSRLSKSVERYIKNQDLHSQFLEDSSILLNLDAVLNMINPIQPFMLLKTVLPLAPEESGKCRLAPQPEKAHQWGMVRPLLELDGKKDGIRPHKTDQGAQAPGTDQN